ncbi:hypothetical protein RR46_07828 [Papilio xuthus]|uniref:MADF domain-containing protein n=1 Tax=Papilio xuthus TaxID=66420 RepID=A0A194QF80_PAPXU|nr:hypothetical protein RR46_07828 [Papilio xuthus]
MEEGSVVFPRKLLKKLIAMYREHPCLWDKNCSSYKQKQKRYEAISKLTQLVQEHDPSATRVHVLRKIESLRACVRREHKRVRDSRLRVAAGGTDGIYKPMLWYYDMFSFVFPDDEIEDVYKKTQTVHEQNEVLAVCKGMRGEAHNRAGRCRFRVCYNSEDAVHDNGDEEGPPFEQSMETYPEYSVANMVNVEDHKRYQLSFEDDNKSSKRHCTEIEDEYDAIGINVAAKLRNLPPNMRILAEKLINDALYQAQMNGLNSSSVITTTDPFNQVII